MFKFHTSRKSILCWFMLSFLVLNDKRDAYHCGSYLRLIYFVTKKKKKASREQISNLCLNYTLHGWFWFCANRTKFCVALFKRAAATVRYVDDGDDEWGCLPNEVIYGMQLPLAGIMSANNFAVCSSAFKLVCLVKATVIQWNNAYCLLKMDMSDVIKV